MRTYPTPESEQARLEALRRFNLLDTPPEEVYQDLVNIAANVLDVPISLVSLIDEDRQWFKASKGLDVTETPREYAFCAHAIMGPDTFVVEDATKDERFAKNPLVTGAPDIRFYMGAPLITSEGHALGSICVIDCKPRHVTPEKKSVLEALRRIAVSLIEQRAVSANLAHALEKVQILSGLLPICAYCKNVRDDQGYWEEISQYVAQHSEVELTHGICPACIERHFPEYASNILAEPRGHPEIDGA